MNDRINFLWKQINEIDQAYLLGLAVYLRGSKVLCLIFKWKEKKCSTWGLTNSDTNLRMETKLSTYIQGVVSSDSLRIGTNRCGSLRGTNHAPLGRIQPRFFVRCCWPIVISTCVHCTRSNLPVYHQYSKQTSSWQTASRFCATSPLSSCGLLICQFWEANRQIASTTDIKGIVRCNFSAFG